MLRRPSLYLPNWNWFQNGTTVALRFFYEVVWMAGMRALIVGGVLNAALTAVALTSGTAHSSEDSNFEILATPTEKTVEVPTSTHAEKLCLDGNLSALAPRDVAKAVIVEMTKTSGQEIQGSFLNASPSVSIKTIFASETFHLDSELKLNSSTPYLDEAQSEKFCNDVVENKDSSGLIGLVMNGLGSAAGAQAGTAKEEGLLMALLPGAMKGYLQSACGKLGSSLKYFRTPTVKRGDEPLRKRDEVIGNGLGNIILLSEQIRKQNRDGQNQIVISIFDPSRGLVYSNVYCSAREKNMDLN